MSQKRGAVSPPKFIQTPKCQRPSSPRYHTPSGFLGVILTFLRAHIGEVQNAATRKAATCHETNIKRSCMFFAPEGFMPSRKTMRYSHHDCKLPFGNVREVHDSPRRELECENHTRIACDLKSNRTSE